MPQIVGLDLLEKSAAVAQAALLTPLVITVLARILWPDSARGPVATFSSGIQTNCMLPLRAKTGFPGEKTSRLLAPSLTERRELRGMHKLFSDVFRKSSSRKLPPITREVWVFPSSLLLVPKFYRRQEILDHFAHQLSRRYSFKPDVIRRQ